MIGFGLVIILASIMVSYAVSSLATVTNTYARLIIQDMAAQEAMQRAQSYIREFRRATASIAMYAPTGNILAVNELSELAESYYSEILRAVHDYIEIITNDEDIQDINQRVSEANELLRLLENYRVEVFDPVYDATRRISHREALTIIDEGAETVALLVERTEDMLSQTRERALNEAEAANELSRFTLMVLIIGAVVTLVFAVILGLGISALISKPIKRLVAVADSVALGQFNVNIQTDSTNEIGTLAHGFAEVISVVQNLVRELNYMADMHYQKGEIEVFLKSDDFPGEFKLVAESVNEMVKQHIETSRYALEVLCAIATKDFNTPMEKLPGKKVFINKIVEDTRKVCIDIDTEINTLILEGTKGRLSARANPERFEGDWASVMVNMNNFINTLVEPMQEAVQVMDRLAQGALDVRMTGDYQGDFKQLQSSINDTVERISSYIEEISRVLKGISQNNLDQSINQNYVGDFFVIKDSLMAITSNLNEMIGNIFQAAENISREANLLASNSGTLEEGSNRQAQSTNELNTSVSIVNASTKRNLESVDQVSDLSEQSRESAVKGNVDVTAMLSAMEGIQNSSNSIAQIVKTIQDIAFQTNLLALNASVEAARAGDHGRGFSVVAEEVRNLATRSQEATQQTAGLIEISGQKVAEGLEVAHRTAEAFNNIMEQVNFMADIIKNITFDSREQATAINNFSSALDEISEVVNTNTATSEEVAAFSQELFGQAESLRDLVSTFILKK